MNSSEAERSEIQRGNINTLVKVLERNFEEAKVRLIHEKEDVRYWQAKAQVLDTLLKWIS